MSDVTGRQGCLLPADWQRHAELRIVLRILVEGAQRVLTAGG